MEDNSKSASDLDTMQPDTGAKDNPSAADSVGANESMETFFVESPVYEPESDFKYSEENNDINTATTADLESAEETHVAVTKRKLSSDESVASSSKMIKLDNDDDPSTQTLDDEVSEITNSAKRKIDMELPSTSRVRTPSRSSPRNVSKRSNSADVTAKTPKTPKSRSASADITSITTRKTPRKVLLKAKDPIVDDEVHIISSDNSSRPSVEFVREIPPPKSIPETIEEDNSELNDSQDFHLVLSPTPDEPSDAKTDTKYNSEPPIVKHRNEMLDAGKVHVTKSDGFSFSDASNIVKEFKGGDLGSNDSTCTMDSPDQMPTVASKLISKLSNGNSSTPTEVDGKHSNDITPDMSKLNNIKGIRAKNESFRASNTTTPSTISPLQNGHSLPINTPQIPVFDVHVSVNEDGEFLSLYVVRTDSDIGMDMCKEYQRISKRFTIDPYLGDVSVSNSPSSVTSGGMINLPNRTSFASSISSTSTSSNRTSDGAFVVPQPPRKSVTNPSASVKGYDALLKKVQDIFSHIRDASVDDTCRSMNEDKISVGIQTSISNETGLSNGNASPEEVNKCDKATPKSSLKKSRVRGRRPIAGKTKRALLPTQPEEPEYMHGMNSPEMVPTNGENDKLSPMKSPKEEKPLSSLVGTPKSVSKLKQKRRPASPRPATPVEKTVVKTEYPGYAPDTVVLAKWVDKRYYSGKVLEITEPNKYLIKFDDGQSKVLLDDFIIFGDMKRLPLQGQSVYAMVDEEQNYEPGLVLGVEENDSGTVTYRCMADGDTIVLVTASELYLTEDQARSIKETTRPHSPAAPSTPRRRHHRELDLDNIIQGPRSARSRDKGSSSAKKRVASPKSPKASTSGVKTKSTPVGGARKRPASESSEMSESSNSAPPVRLEEVPGVEPEVQRTPRKIDGVKAGPLQLKGAAKQTVGKKNSKLAKFSDDADTLTSLGPIPTTPLFANLHFLLTCTEPPRERQREREKAEKAREKGEKGEKGEDREREKHFLLTCTEPPRERQWEREKDEKAREKGEDREWEKSQDTRHYSSEEDGETTSTLAGTDTEDLVFCDRPFNKERLKEQLEAGGGVVYSHFDDVPKSKYGSCKLISPRPCLTAKYIQCVAAGIRAVSHAWVVGSCIAHAQLDPDAYVLPTGWSLLKERFINWVPATGKRNTTFFKDKTILLCGDQDTVKFWERVCTMAGANTRVVNEEDLNMSGALALVTEWDCPHEVQNKANQDNIPLVSTHWVIQCLIEGRVIPPTSHDKFSFMYTEQE